MGVIHGKTLEPGDQAPDFSLLDQNRNQVTLSAYRGVKSVVVAFYIKAFTGRWTQEMKAYQADIAKFERAGTQMIGISVDNPQLNRAFASSLGITYPILSDVDRAVSRAYGVLMPILHYAKRATFVLDRQGVVKAVYRGKEAVDPVSSLAACCSGAPL